MLTLENVKNELKKLNSAQIGLLLAFGFKLHGKSQPFTFAPPLSTGPSSRSPKQIRKTAVARLVRTGEPFL
jgi:hypothetical protein